MVEKDLIPKKYKDDDFQSTVVETAIATVPANLVKEPICDDSTNLTCASTKLSTNERKITKSRSRKRKNMFD